MTHAIDDGSGIIGITRILDSTDIGTWL